MKKTIVLLLSLGLCGCAIARYDKFLKNTRLGMSKGEVITSCGSPLEWNKRVIDGKIYESLNYNPFLGSYDFVDNVLVGYSRREPFGDTKYYSANDTEKVRNYTK